ncbi:hypothetical protein ACAW74_25770 [Fibrella sp. WM1]|uniref:hypothetical protein n=1 Tax=Fibrella musci TaxID=3242485 RepID=UPI003522DEBF
MCQQQQTSEFVFFPGNAWTLALRFKWGIPDDVTAGVYHRYSPAEEEESLRPTKEAPQEGTGDVTFTFSAEQTATIETGVYILKVFWRGLFRISSPLTPSMWADAPRRTSWLVDADVTALVNTDIAQASATRIAAQTSAEEANIALQNAELQASLAQQAALLAQSIAASLNIGFGNAPTIQAVREIPVERTTLFVVASDVEGDETDVWCIKQPDGRCLKFLTQLL